MRYTILYSFISLFIVTLVDGVQPVELNLAREKSIALDVNAMTAVKHGSPVDSTTQRKDLGAKQEQQRWHLNLTTPQVTPASEMSEVHISVDPKAVGQHIMRSEKTMTVESALVTGVTADLITKKKLAGVDAGAIPKIIWITQKSRKELDPINMQHLNSLNPGYDIRFCDDGAVEQFMKDVSTSDGPKYLQTYHQIRAPAHRADFWRYLVLLKHGGYYIDSDNELEMPLENISKGYDFVSVIAGTDPHGVCVHNGFIASVPGNFVMRHLVDHFLQYPNPPADYPLFKYHFYVRHFFVWLNNHLHGLKPLVSYSSQGLRMYFLYIEFPDAHVINGDRQVALMVPCPRKLSRAKLEVESNLASSDGYPTRLPDGYPSKLDLKSKKWSPVNPPDMGGKY